MLPIYRAIGCALTALSCLSGTLRAVQPTTEELTASHHWIRTHWENETNAPPFSFEYGGQGSAELLKRWPVQRATKVLDPARTQHTLTYQDPQTHLEVQCDIIEYTNYPAVEWVVYFENKGANDTPILENVQGMGITLVRGKSGEFVLHHAPGNEDKLADFQPLADPLPPNTTFKLFSGGLSSIESLPFFNVEAVGEGVIGAIGWSGSWEAKFVRDGGRSLSIRAGMPRVHLLLHPGERIRTPRILLMLWNGERIRAHNLWRRLLLDYYSPHPEGKLVTLPLSDSNAGGLTADRHVAKVNWWREHNLPMEVYWIDAGWSGDLEKKGWDEHTANRVANPRLYPAGMRSVADAAHQRGMKFLLWFVPHAILPGVEVGQWHPEFVTPGGLNHGNPVVNRWMIEYYSKIIEDYGIDIFREDGARGWPKDETPDREGINEIRYFEGFYAWCDALLRRHPGLVIDNCAGGAAKVDLETIRRSVCLWRSDYPNFFGTDFDPICMQIPTYGLSFWIPLHGGGAATKVDAYSIRSVYSPGAVMCWDGFSRKIRTDDFNFGLARKLLNEYLAVRPCFYGDYYPLTAYNDKQDGWMAWQFDRPDLGEGMMQAFRRKESPYEAARFKPGGLDPQAEYMLTDADHDPPRRMSGRELMEKGILVGIPARPGAVVITYKKVKL